MGGIKKVWQKGLQSSIWITECDGITMCNGPHRWRGTTFIFHLYVLLVDACGVALCTKRFCNRFWDMVLYFASASICTCGKSDPYFVKLTK